VHPITRALSEMVCVRRHVSSLRCNSVSRVLQMHELIKQYGLGMVQSYMGHIMNAARDAVMNMLVDFSLRRGLGEVRAC
jgi:hypothetical protein